MAVPPTRLTREHELSRQDGHCVTIVIRVTPCPVTPVPSPRLDPRLLTHPVLFVTVFRFLTHASSRPGISTSYHTDSPRWISTNHMAIPATTLLCPVTPVITRLPLWPPPVLPRAYLSQTAREWRGSHPGPFIDDVNPVLPRSISFSLNQMQHLQSRVHVAGHGRRLFGKSAQYHSQARTRS
jgi:hypothetical protein